jgi:hypothetical protein
MTTAESKTDPAEIAAGLTGAMQSWLRFYAVGTDPGRPARQRSKQTHGALCRRRLLGFGPNGLFGITPLGRAVAAHLEETP